MLIMDPKKKNPNENIPINAPTIAASRFLRFKHATTPTNAKIEKIAKINVHPDGSNSTLSTSTPP